MFRASQHPSSGALKTVTATSGIGHNTGTVTTFQHDLFRTLTLNHDARNHEFKILRFPALFLSPSGQMMG